MTSRKGTEHTIQLKGEGVLPTPLNRTAIWEALKFVLLNRPQFLPGCESSDTIDVKKDGNNETYRVEIVHTSGPKFIEEILFSPFDSATVVIEASKDYEKLELKIMIEEAPDGEFQLRFSYCGGPRKGQLPEQYLSLVHAAWKAKDEEIVAGILQVLDHPRT